MLLQFPCDDVLFKFLSDIFVITLSNFDNAFDFSIDRFCKHIFHIHILFTPQSTSLKAL